MNVYYVVNYLLVKKEVMIELKLEMIEIAQRIRIKENKWKR